MKKHEKKIEKPVVEKPKKTAEEYRRMYAAQDAREAEEREDEADRIPEEEVYRRKNAGFKVWFPLKLSHRIFETQIPLHYHHGYTDLVFWGKEGCYLFPSVEKIEAFAALLAAKGVILEKFERGWRVK
jgi:hypothetical protein